MLADLHYNAANRTNDNSGAAKTLPHPIFKAAPVAVLASLFAIMPLRAAESGQLLLSGQVFKEVVQSDGNGAVRRALVPASQMVRGDRLVFVVRYRNAAPNPVNGYVITVPFPATVRYQDNPRQPVEVSVDGGRNWGALDRLYRLTGNGVPTPVSADRVTHVRIRLSAPVQPGASGQITYRGIVR